MGGARSTRDRGENLFRAGIATARAPGQQLARWRWRRLSLRLSASRRRIFSDSMAARIQAVIYAGNERDRL